MGSKNPLVITTLTTAVSTASLAAVWYLLGKPQDIAEIAVFAVVFWTVFLVVQKLLGRK
jgi:hypothetical protein